VYLRAPQLGGGLSTGLLELGTLRFAFRPLVVKNLLDADFLRIRQLQVVRELLYAHLAMLLILRMLSQGHWR
jgi:hypothetical protein